MEMSMTTGSASFRVDAFVTAHVAPSLRRLIAAFRAWERRKRSRREFAAMSDFERKDLGYPTGADVESLERLWRT
jgi:uncharacterized protein YjiS (DUF1127 family)